MFANIALNLKLRMSVQTVRPFTDIALRMAIRIIPPIWARAIRYSYLLAAEVHAKALGKGGVSNMTLTEMFNICDSCVYAPCFCGNEPENCVAYLQRNNRIGKDVK